MYRGTKRLQGKAEQFLQSGHKITMPSFQTAHAFQRYTKSKESFMKAVSTGLQRPCSANEFTIAWMSQHTQQNTYKTLLHLLNFN